MEISFTTTVTTEFSPRELAEIFCKMHSDEQAEFFNTINEEVQNWDHHLCFQLARICEEKVLTNGGREVMQLIGEYAYPEKDIQP